MIYYGILLQAVTAAFAPTCTIFPLNLAPAVTTVATTGKKDSKAQLRDRISFKELS